MSPMPKMALKITIFLSEKKIFPFNKKIIHTIHTGLLKKLKIKVKEKKGHL